MNPFTSSSQRSGLHQPIQHVLLVAGVAVAALVFPAAGQAAQITYDLRAVETGVLAGDVTSPNVIIQNGGKSILNYQGGNVIVLQLFAIVVGNDANPNNDGFSSAFGSFVFNNVGGGLFGTIRGDTPGSPASLVNNPPGFGSTGTAQAGFQAVLPGTGDGVSVGNIDNQGGPVTVPWFLATSTAPGNVTFGTTHLIGETTVTLGPGVTSQQFANVNFYPRDRRTGIVTSQQTNKVYIDGSPVGYTTADTDHVLVADAVYFTIPEPSAIGTLLLGSLGLIAFRRRVAHATSH